VKRTLALGGSIALVIAAIWIGIALMDQPSQRDKDTVSCPVYFFGTLSQTIPGDHLTSRWKIYSYDGEKGTAKVTVSASPLSTPARPSSCRLDIERAPETPGKASDWRVGHVIKPDSFRGKTVRYRVAIKSEQDILLDSGQIYVYDGVNAIAAPTPRLTQEWRTYEVTFKVDPAATTFELWFRLLLDKGTVKPGKGTVYFVPEVEIQGG